MYRNQYTLMSSFSWLIVTLFCFTKTTEENEKTDCMLFLQAVVIKSRLMFTFAGRVTNNQLWFIFHSHDVVMLRGTIFL